ncbi:MAG: glutathione S-transferase [Hyphomicrobiales bacterium]|nr:MAG: glutathione S-transferase [Hyphomicrobiales bacterium]
MARLHSFSLCPFSRRIRLALAECGHETDLVSVSPWKRDESFLILNPSGALPVLETGGLTVCGAYAITEYLEENGQTEAGEKRLMPEDPAGRAEVRRLISWFDEKFHAEVSGPLAHEKLARRELSAANGGGAPDTTVVRAAIHNIHMHMNYIGYLTERRRWLAGDQLSHADLAAAAHVSVVDYLGDVPWERHEAAKEWYARIKSRPSFRGLLKDRIAGMAPPDSYADLDF